MSNTKKKRNILPEKENRFSQKLDRFYECLSKYFLWVSLLCLAVTLLFDLTPAPYYTWAEVFFCYRDFTSLISTSVVIWAFGASLLVYFMGKMETRCFGIRFYEVLPVHEGEFGLACKLLLFLAELTLMGFSGMYDLPITAFAICLLQPFNVIYILLIIMLETSPNRLVQTIHAQTKQVLAHLAHVRARLDQPVNTFSRLDEELKCTDWLLMRALRSINYYQHEDMDTLSGCLPTDVWSPLAAHPDVQLLVSWKLACRMVDGGQESTDGDPELPLALMEWFRGIVSNPACPFFVQEGILAALLVYGKDLSPALFEGLLAAIQGESHGKAADWNVQLLRPLTDCGILPGRKYLLHKLEGFREEHGCQPGHTLPLEDKELLDGFLNYLGYRPPSQEEIEEIHAESFTEEELTINV